MSLKEALLDLDTAAHNISKGVNAVQLMSQGLNRTLDPYADGFDALCDYLLEADEALRRQVDICLKALA